MLLFVALGMLSVGSDSIREVIRWLKAFQQDKLYVESDYVTEVKEKLLFFQLLAFQFISEIPSRNKQAITSLQNKLFGGFSLETALGLDADFYSHWWQQFTNTKEQQKAKMISLDKLLSYVQEMESKTYYIQIHQLCSHSHTITCQNEKIG